MNSTNLQDTTTTLSPATASASLTSIDSLPPMLTPRDVAGLLKIGVSTLAALRKAGKFGPSPKRFGGSVRFVSAEVVAWIDAGCPGASEWNDRGECGR